MSAIGKPHCAVYIILNSFKNRDFRNTQTGACGPIQWSSDYLQVIINFIKVLC